MSSKEVVVKSSNGIGLGGILTIIFVLAKLFGVINWSWLWVFSPLWIGAGIMLSILAIILIFALIIAIVAAFVR